MPASLNDWVNRLRNRPLPAMALTARRVAQLIDRPSTTNTDYQTILARDPGLTLALFRHLASLPQPPRERIGNLAHAVALSGTAPLLDRTRDVPLLKEPDRIDSGEAVYGCYARAAHAAFYAYQWGLRRKDANPEEMAIAALLHDCGEMALWAHARETMEKIHGHMQREMSRESAALAVLGFTLNQLSQSLAEVWLLPPLTGDALQPLGAFKSRSLGVMLAWELAGSSLQDWGSESTLELLQLVAEYCRIGDDHATAYVHQLSAQAARSLHGLPLPLSAHRLLQLRPEAATPCSNEAPDSVVGEVPQPAEPPGLEESVEESPPERQEQAVQPSQAEPSILTETPLLRLMNQQAEDRRSKPGSKEASDQPQTAGKTGHSGAHATQRKRTAGAQGHLIAVTDQLRERLGLERAMFAMLTPDKKMLRARFVTGAGRDEPLGRFQLGLERRHLFSLLITKPHGIWLNHANREKYLPVIPDQLHSTLNLEGFFASSLFVAHRPLGILYADASDPSQLNSEGFGQFQQLARELGVRLGGGARRSRPTA